MSKRMFFNQFLAGPCFALTFSLLVIGIEHSHNEDDSYL
jgi:hypothetical protein